ncbi:hypothetical protein JCM11641_006977 [Rhodosporidiobolus odoratus]
MADYWVSRDKYFCKYCKIYISDDKPSRTHHETGLRHKGNYERYIRDIYKKGMTEKKEAREEAREVQRIEAAAAAAMGLEAPEPSASSSSSKPKPTPTPASKSDPYANYTTAASLGIVDDYAEKKREEQELRLKEGRIGEWERVIRPQAFKPQTEAAVPTGGFVSTGTGGGGVKREEGEGGEEEDEKPSFEGGHEGRAAAQPAPEEESDHPYASRKRFFTELIAPLPDDLLDDDAHPLPLPTSIKLKKRRLTVKEQAALDAEAAAKGQAEEEAKRKAVERGAREGGGWSATSYVVEGEGEEFAPLAGEGVGASGSADEKGRGGAEGAGAEGGEEKPIEEKKEEKVGGFKKRKMMGKGVVRKK